MSAADRLFAKKPLLGHLMTLMISMIGIFTVYALDKSDLTERELIKKVDDKADKILVEEYRKEAKEYTDQRINGVEVKTQIELNNIKNTQQLMFEFIRSNMTDIKEDIKILKEKD